MNNNARAWVAALRSGKYQQGAGCLNIDGRFCCLGVACEVYIKTGHRLSAQVVYGRTLYGGHAAYLPDEVTVWLGLSTFCGAFNPSATNIPDCSDLATMNDGSVGFVEIADFIEGEPKGLFSHNV